MSMRLSSLCILLCLSFLNTLAFSALPAVKSAHSPLLKSLHHNLNSAKFNQLVNLKETSAFTASTTETRLCATKSAPLCSTASSGRTGFLASAAASPLVGNLKVGGIFALWFALNVNYNIFNKKLLTLAGPGLTYTVAWIQLFIGLLYILPVWALKLRPRPELTSAEVKKLIPVAVTHTLTHLGAVVSLGAGAVSFTHIVKSAEPAVSALLSAIFLKSYLPIPVYLSLIPVMAGVAMASLTELSFNWLSFSSAMVSNVASASRGIVGKMSMGKDKVGKNMDAANLYAVLTIMSTLMVLPVALAVEGGRIIPTIQKIIAAGDGPQLGKLTLLSGFLYYLYNEVAFLALDNVAPVTHALGNTIKRVVIIVASVIAFGTPMSTQGMVGSSVAIGGVLLYSLAKNYFQ